MFYISRDTTGAVLSVSRTPAAGLEVADEHDPAVLAFLHPHGQDFNHLDADFVRVIEDVIDTLIQNNVMKLTDLPAVAQHKLMARKGMRNKLHGALNLLGDDSMIL